MAPMTCDAARRAMETHRFTGWRGLPQHCTPDALFGVPFDDQWGGQPLGSDFGPARTHLLELGGYYRPMAYVREGHAVMFDAMTPALDGGWPVLAADLGTPEATFDWVFGTTPHGRRRARLRQPRYHDLPQSRQQRGRLHIRLCADNLRGIREELAATTREAPESQVDDPRREDPDRVLWRLPGDAAGRRRSSGGSRPRHLRADHRGDRRGVPRRMTVPESHRGRGRGPTACVHCRRRSCHLRRSKRSRLRLTERWKLLVGVHWMSSWRRAEVVVPPR